MANNKTAIKRIKISEVKRAKNVSAKSSIKTNIRKFDTARAEGNTESATALYIKITSMLDKAASKGIIHKNTAARHKSRLASRM